MDVGKKRADFILEVLHLEPPQQTLDLDRDGNPHFDEYYRGRNAQRRIFVVRCALGDEQRGCTA